nr:TerB family tellurite resistance protein [Oceanococcus sp. HetDA_MAG_MS8]
MLARWLNQLTTTQEDSSQSAQQRLRLAMAVLLVDVARADWEDDPRERQSICQSLQAHCQLSPADAESLLVEAEGTRDDVASLHSYLRVINEEATQEQKQQLLDSLWKVAFADGELAAYEEHTIRRMAELLYLPHADFIQSKLRHQPGSDT